MRGFTQSIFASPHQKLKWCSFSFQSLNTFRERNSAITIGYAQKCFSHTETSRTKNGPGRGKVHSTENFSSTFKVWQNSIQQKRDTFAKSCEIINPWENNLRSCWMPTEAPHGRFSTQHAIPLGKYEEIRRAARTRAESAAGLTHPFPFPPFSRGSRGGRCPRPAEVGAPGAAPPSAERRPARCRPAVLCSVPGVSAELSWPPADSGSLCGASKIFPREVK